MGELAIMDRDHGDLKVIWDKDNEAEVEAARAQFDQLQKKGYLAYTVTGQGRKGTQVREFDEDAEKIILAPALRGG